MNEQRSQQHPQAAQPAVPRKPFVKPVVHNLGGLAQLTLLGGSGGGG